MEDCIFCKIVRGEIPARKVYEDDDILAFHDIRPIAPVHFLIIPKIHIPTLGDAAPQHQLALGKIMTMAGPLARQQGADQGFRAIINSGKVGLQEVYHVHMHIIGGPEPLPPMLVRRRTDRAE